MASSTRQDWSDEEEDDVIRTETSVFLGIPDGTVDSASDLKDAAVSRIGGLPALLSHKVPFDSSRCQHCKNPMELLVQLWAPLENSPYDRAVYVWGCARSGCQRKGGSIRAWRGLRYDEKYASKLERKRKEHQRAPPAPVEAKPTHQNVNPFSMSTDVAKMSHSGLGSDMFNSVLPLDSGGTITSQGSVPDESIGSDDDSASTSSVASAIVAFASVTLVDTLWQSAPSYPPQYLSTANEYIPPPNKEAPDEPTAGIVDDDGVTQEGHAWASEKYEKSMHTDHVFDRFNERTSHEPQQCVRYDLGGIPMPFASDDLYKRLFPLSTEKSTSITVTRAASNVQHSRPGRGYSAASILACPHCGSRRTFEYQLMPNLIIMLGRGSDTEREDITTTDEQRKEVVQRLLKRDPDGRGMEWGTALVFTCEKDCCLGPGNKEKEGAWSEELVLVHWDD
ncbi:programmed cell death protein 2 [Russula emetica]|nr:programmed cell death protein 2 [Russula emetica]